jgi:elongation factor Ts
MAEITAALVKELREKSGAGMMDCKRALTEADGDPEIAYDNLRKKGLAAAAKKAGRVASEGLVGVVTDGSAGAMIEVNSETDFVARNETFQGFARALSHAVLREGDDLAKLGAATLPEYGATAAEQLNQMIATIGENMAIRRAHRLEVPNGVVIGYVHNATAPGLGKIGVLVALESTGEAALLGTLGKQIAMHVAAAAPRFLDQASVDPEALERERDVLREQARASGTPENIIEKMVEGRIRKFYEEVVLLEQIYVVDGESKVAAVIADAAKKAGSPVRLAGFARFVLGEGVEKPAEDAA